MLIKTWLNKRVSLHHFFSFFCVLCFTFFLFYFIVKSEPQQQQQHTFGNTTLLNGMSMRNIKRKHWTCETLCSLLIQLEQFLLWLMWFCWTYSGDDTSSQLQICSAKWKNRKNFAGTNHRKLLLLSHSAFIHCDQKWIICGLMFFFS